MSADTYAQICAELDMVKALLVEAFEQGRLMNFRPLAKAFEALKAEIRVTR